MNSFLTICGVVFVIQLFWVTIANAESDDTTIDKRRSMHMLRLGRGYNRGVRGFHMLRLGKRDNYDDARLRDILSSIAAKDLYSRQAPLPRYGRELIPVDDDSSWDPTPRLGRFKRSTDNEARAVPIPRFGRDDVEKDEVYRAVPMPRFGKDISEIDRRAMHMLRLGKRRMMMLRLGKKAEKDEKRRAFNMLRLGRAASSVDEKSS